LLESHSENFFVNQPLGESDLIGVRAPYLSAIGVEIIASLHDPNARQSTRFHSEQIE
jgi:hypothetical protein